MDKKRSVWDNVYGGFESVRKKVGLHKTTREAEGIPGRAFSGQPETV